MRASHAHAGIHLSSSKCEDPLRPATRKHQEEPLMFFELFNHDASMSIFVNRSLVLTMTLDRANAKSDDKLLSIPSRPLAVEFKIQVQEGAARSSDVMSSVEHVEWEPKNEAQRAGRSEERIEVYTDSEEILFSSHL